MNKKDIKHNMMMIFAKYMKALDDDDKMEQLILLKLLLKEITKL